MITITVIPTLLLTLTHLKLALTIRKPILRSRYRLRIVTEAHAFLSIFRLCCFDHLRDPRNCHCALLFA